MACGDQLQTLRIHCDSQPEELGPAKHVGRAIDFCKCADNCVEALLGGSDNARSNGNYSSILGVYEMRKGLLRCITRFLRNN